MSDDTPDNSNPENFRELIQRSESLAQKVSSLFNGEKMLPCMVALLLLIKSSTKECSVEAMQLGIGEQDMPPELVMKTMAAFSELEEAADTVMTHYAACIIGREIKDQVKEYYDNLITDDELEEGRENLGDLCNSLFNPSDE